MFILSPEQIELAQKKDFGIKRKLDHSYKRWKILGRWLFREISVAFSFCPHQIKFHAGFRKAIRPSTLLDLICNDYRRGNAEVSKWTSLGITEGLDSRKLEKRFYGGKLIPPGTCYSVARKLQF